MQFTVITNRKFTVEAETEAEAMTAVLALTVGDGEAASTQVLPVHES